ncbi:MAG: iron-containing alcohol dehydrogenase family protein [Halanaerobiales bacterium]|nr:iron-containing alcohol dehydrogenase family protein [Halanaerobiales bacterium]
MVVNVKIPSAYNRGEGVLQGIGQFSRDIAEKVLVIGGKKALNAVKEQLLKILNEAGIEVVGVEWYGGETTWENIKNISKIAKEKGAELLITVGGGKALDTGKAAAYMSEIPCITVPTIAATCAAYTPLSIIHNDMGVYVENTPNSACPTSIFVDTSIIVNAPTKWFYAGMGDTLAKWYELRATTSNIPRTSWTIGGITNGKICYEIIEEFGPVAKEAIEKQEVTDSFEYVIDAIILYAGMSSILGGEKCRGAASHSVYFGFTNIPAAHHTGHGLLVGFGNLCLLALENRSEDELLTEIKLSKECGVPIKLSEIADLTEEDLMKVAKVACDANDMKNMPMEVTPEMVVEAIKLIDKLSVENF